MTIDKEEIKAIALACDPSKCADEDEENRRLAEFYSELTPEAVLTLLAEIDQLGAERELFLLAGKSLKDDVVRLKAENEALRSALLEASEEVATWGAYASEYFQEKHDLAGCVAKIHAAAMAKEASHDHE